MKLHAFALTLFAIFIAAFAAAQPAVAQESADVGVSDAQSLGGLGSSQVSR